MPGKLIQMVLLQWFCILRHESVGQDMNMNEYEYIFFLTSENKHTPLPL